MPTAFSGQLFIFRDAFAQRFIGHGKQKCLSAAGAMEIGEFQFPIPCRFHFRNKGLAAGITYDFMFHAGSSINPCW
jgi:hypothetical protein